MYLTRTIFLFTLACLGLSSFGQKAEGYEPISVAQGLSQGMVLSMIQDREGFIWVATKNGLNRYDGYGFKIFTNDPYNNHSLSSNTVIMLFEDSKGRIWAGTENAGLNVYDKKSGKFFRIAHQSNNAGSLSGNRIRNTIAETPDGKILVGAEEAGLNVISLPDKYFGNDSVAIIKRVSLPGNTQVYGIGRDKKGTMWISGLDNKVYSFNVATNQFTPFANAKFYNSGYCNDAGDIWINGNFFLWDGKSVVPLFDMSAIAPGNLIMNPIRDPWTHFHEQLFFYDISRWEPGQPIQWNKDLPFTKDSKVLYPFLIDRAGILWVGTKGYGLHKYNIAQNKFSLQEPGFSVRYIVPAHDAIYLGAYPYQWRKLANDSSAKNVFSDILPNHTIDNVIVSKTGDYWIRTDDAGLFKYNVASKKLTPFPLVQANNGQGDKQPMLEDRKGNIWFPALAGQMTRINATTDQTFTVNINSNPARPMPPKAICTALYEDGQGVYWIGTEDGFAKVDFAGGQNNPPQITWFYNHPDDRNSLNYNHVSCFIDDPAAPENFLWICTKGGGLNRLNKKTGDFFHLTSKDGLPNDVVYGILTDEARNIWGSTNKGIFCLTLSKNNSLGWSFRNFTKSDGLQDDEFNTGAYAKLDDGRLAFGGVNGLNIFDPKDVLVAGYTPDVFITGIMVNNQPVAAGDNSQLLNNTIEKTESIVLSWQQDILTLEFSALDFTAPAQNKYRYRLSGADKVWVESGARRTATYLHLPAGKYTFEVQGSNSQGVWSNKIAQLHIQVLPPWWRSWWAYLFYVLMAALVVRSYFLFTVGRAKLKAQLSFEKLEAKKIKELDTVKTQLYTNITHEFRTPLTVILGMAQQIVDKPKENFASGMEMIIRNGQSLLKLVNEMLDLSKLETGKMSLQMVNGDVVNFLQYITETFQSLAESQQKQLHFLSEIDSLYMAYDPEKMRQIVSNLLSNAIKFTPEKGNIYISVNEQERAGETDQSVLSIKVKDTGIGIAEAQLSHIFDRFYQADNSHTREAGGTGIGLALTKELVRLMDGEIIAKSPPAGSSKGSEFTVLLPVKKLTDQQPVVNTEVRVHAELSRPAELRHEVIAIQENGIADRPLILLVEDNADVVAYTASCLPDYRLAVAKDGREGLEIAAEIIPDLVITDVMMPFVDGFELSRRLRDNEHTSHIPIILLTAKADIESKIEGLDTGADAYLEKPFNREELLMRIKKLLELRKKLQQVYLKRAGLSARPMVDELVPATKAEDEFVQKVRLAVEASLSDTKFTVEQLCKIVFMSHSQLHRKLDALTGCSPNKFIRMIRLKKAKQLLSETSDSIGALALDCGYNDPGYFARIFKQEFGATPQEWRGARGVNRET